MIIGKALKFAIEKLQENNINSAQLDAEVLLIANLREFKGEFTRINKAWFYSHPEFELSKKQIRKFKIYIFRRSKGEPVAYIINKKEFYGLNFYVNKHVLIPRPETELLVEETLSLLKTQLTGNRNKKIKILEIGTGSGCVMISLAKKLSANFIATDISQKALRVAKKNARKHGVKARINFIKSNLLSSGSLVAKLLGMTSPYIVVANLPYLTQEQYKNNPDLKFEPKKALVGDLKYIKKLLKQIYELKNKPRYVLLEIDPSQKLRMEKLPARQCQALAGGKINWEIKFKKDLAGKDRVAVIKI